MSKRSKERIPLLSPRDKKIAKEALQESENTPHISIGEENILLKENKEKILDLHENFSGLGCKSLLKFLKSLPVEDKYQYIRQKAKTLILTHKNEDGKTIVDLAVENDDQESRKELLKIISDKILIQALLFGELTYQQKLTLLILDSQNNARPEEEKGGKREFFALIFEEKRSILKEAAQEEDFATGTSLIKLERRQLEKWATQYKKDPEKLEEEAGKVREFYLSALKEVNKEDFYAECEEKILEEKKALSPSQFRKPSKSFKPQGSTPSRLASTHSSEEDLHSGGVGLE